MDDDSSLREVYGRLLTHLGYTPDRGGHRRGGAVPLHAGKTNRYALPCGDHGPDRARCHGGKEAVQRLLEIDPKAVAIISSGYSNDPVMANYRDYGFKDVIGKPFTAEKLSEVLWKVLK